MWESSRTAWSPSLGVAVSQLRASRLQLERRPMCMTLLWVSATAYMTAWAVQEVSGALVTFWHRYVPPGRSWESHGCLRRLGGTLSVQIMESSSLEILKTWQHGSEEPALVNPALSSGVGLYDLQRPLTTSAILWILGVNFEDTEMVMSFFMSSQLSLLLTPEYQKTNIPKSAVRWSNNKVHTSILNTKHLWGF